VTDPLFWLVLSLLFVTVSLTIVLVVAIPALREMARAARSAEKLFDTLRREFPPTLEAIRLTGMEISDLTDDVSEGVQSAGNVVKQVDESLSNVRRQAQKVQSGSRNLLLGVKVAWKTFTRSQKPPSQRRQIDRLPSSRPEREFQSPPYSDFTPTDSFSNEPVGSGELNIRPEPIEPERQLPHSATEPAHNEPNLNPTDFAKRVSSIPSERRSSQTNPSARREILTAKQKVEPSPQDESAEIDS
jgi:uncharacterized protein YoxC